MYHKRSASCRAARVAQPSARARSAAQNNSSTPPSAASKHAAACSRTCRCIGAGQQAACACSCCMECLCQSRRGTAAAQSGKAGCCCGCRGASAAPWHACMLSHRVAVACRQYLGNTCARFGSAAPGGRALIRCTTLFATTHAHSSRVDRITFASGLLCKPLVIDRSRTGQQPRPAPHTNGVDKLRAVQLKGALDLVIVTAPNNALHCTQVPRSSQKALLHPVHPSAPQSFTYINPLYTGCHCIPGQAQGGETEGCPGPNHWNHPLQCPQLRRQAKRVASSSSLHILLTAIAQNTALHRIAGCDCSPGRTQGGEGQGCPGPAYC